MKFFNLFVLLLFSLNTSLNLVSANCCMEIETKVEMNSSNMTDCPHHKTNQDKVSKNENQNNDKKDKNCNKECCKVISQFELKSLLDFYPISFELIPNIALNLHLKSKAIDTFRPPIS